MKNAHCRTWILERKLKNLESKKSTPKDLEYGEKNPEKRRK
jgi:hypothetical protein